LSVLSWTMSVSAGQQRERSLMRGERKDASGSASHRFDRHRRVSAATDRREIPDRPSSPFRRHIPA